MQISMSQVPKALAVNQESIIRFRVTDDFLVPPIMSYRVLANNRQVAKGMILGGGRETQEVEVTVIPTCDRDEDGRLTIQIMPPDPLGIMPAMVEEKINVDFQAFPKIDRPDQRQPLPKPKIATTVI